MSGPLETIKGIVGGEGDPDDVLRSVVDTLAGEAGVSWAGIVFLEDGGPTSGPQAGDEDASRRIDVPITFGGRAVAELRVDGDADPELLRRVAELISPHCLVGWDTGGVPWGDVP